MDNRIMTEELNNSDTEGDKNWKEMREKLNLYEAKIAELQRLKESATKTIAEADDTIKVAQDSINEVHKKFEATLKALHNQIDKDITDIERFL